MKIKSTYDPQANSNDYGKQGNAGMPAYRRSLKSGMKALMLSFLIILFQSCFSAGPNNNRTSQHDDEQSSSSPKDKTEKPIAQQSDKQYTSLKDFQLETSTDSLRPTQSWTFNYTDGTFPSDSSHWDECLIKGFDTDGKGRFYFLGGEPVRLTCYNGEKLERTRGHRGFPTPLWTG